MRQRVVGATLAGAALAVWSLLALVGGRHAVPSPPVAVTGSSVAAPPSAASSAASADPSPTDDALQCVERPLRLPKGEPASLSCAATRKVVAQVRARIALPTSSPQPALFAEAVSGWLDPHGMWSASPDSPVRSLLKRNATRLLQEMEVAVADPSKCAAAEELGRATKSWVAVLRGDLQSGARSVRSTSPARAFGLASEGVFQDDPVTRPARELARDLGRRIESFRRVFGNDHPAARHAAERLLPDLTDEQWTGAVLAAALRAYIPIIDPHGQWAPFEEEWSLYSADPALGDDGRLWGRMTRTALGISVAEDAEPPLLDGDLVLSVAGVATAGLSVEQVEQLAHLEPVGVEVTRQVIVLRRGEKRTRQLSVDLEPDSRAPVEELSKAAIAFGDGQVWVVAVPDVPDELGDELEQLVTSAHEGDAPLAILLDLRGNGGGSLDGAVGAIGVFLPGVPSFPLRRRDGVIEIQAATSPPRSAQWRGPVAALVDGYTASAAEMIAGALESYRRGPVVGSRTFGKGCVQEYFDDIAGVGVLRLTTMLFSLPDGSPLQGVGLTPDLQMLLPAADERERSIPGALESWRGPDVRRASAMGGVEWPRHRGRVGPCSDPTLCSALRRLGLPGPSAAMRPSRAPRRASP